MALVRSTTNTPWVDGVTQVNATELNALGDEINNKQPIATLAEAVQDIVAAFVVAGTNVTATYNDTTNTLTLSATGGTGGGLDAEAVQDLIGSTVVAGTNVTVTYNDAAGTFTIAAAGGYYTPGGTDVAMLDGGTGVSLTAPSTDKILFYDQSVGAVGFLAPSTGVAISGTDLIGTGGGGGGAPAYELVHVFAGDTNGTPVTAESGQTWNLTNSRTPNLTVLSGKLYSADTVAGAQFAHAGVTLSATAAYMAADFNFGSTGTTNTQSFELAAWVAALTSPFNIPPDSPCRIICTDDHIEYRVVTGAVSTTILSHPYSARGTSNQRVEVVIDKTNSIAVLKAPDGQVITVGHSLIGSLTAPNVTAASFLGAASTDKRVEIQTFSAGPTALTDAKRTLEIAYAQLAIPVVVTGSYTVLAKDMNKIIEYNSTSAGNITIPPEATMGVANGSGFGVRQTNTGAATIVAGAGVTTQSNGSLTTDGQYAEIGAAKRAANTWFITGDTA